ncbi:FecR family protein [Pedobacter helvus]|uniref:FecR family protein n=1 Tax=Pedobacter helvus TaxID=2563444 RepID=UPI0038FC102E
MENALTDDEQIEWAEVLEDASGKAFVLELMGNTWKDISPGQEQHLQAKRSEEIYAGVVSAPQQQLRTRKLWTRIAAAASLLLILGAGVFFYTKRDLVKPGTELAAVQDVAPGSNKAFLTLADGRRIELTGAGNGQLATQGGLVLSKTADGQLVYEVKNDDGAAEDVMLSNTVETPRGGQYQVKLPDGTRVWLNAASKLEYPLNFKNAKERTVRLQGEGYFEVAKDKLRPFVVRSAGQQVRVLGTHFNISAYGDEFSVKTTLLEGSVKVSIEGKAEGKVMVPGEQAVLTGGALKVSEVDVKEAAAWKNGEFIFEQETIGSIMRKLSRWYDVEVVYEDNLADKTFSGSMSRFETVSQVLSKIEMTDLVRFKVEGRRIIVRK